MPRSLPFPKGRWRNRGAPNDSDGGGNRILQRLPPNDLSLLRPQLKLIDLEQGTILHEAGAPLEYVYFPTSGMVSVLAIMRTGDAIETAVIGREGVVGGSIGSEGSLSFGQSMVQIPGSALRIGAKQFLKVLAESNGLRSLVNRYQSVVLLQAQTIGCLSCVPPRRRSLVPVAIACIGRHRKRYGQPDARVSLSHAWRAKDIGLADRPCAAKIRADPLLARQDRNHRSARRGRMCL
jgi:CRP-like cAMP-binding protein